MSTEFPTSIQNTQDRVFKKYDELVAQVEAGNATVETTALFTLEGEWVPARLVESKFGLSWLIVDKENKSTGVFVPYKPKKRETLAKRGYVEGTIRVAAKAILAGGFRPTASLAPANENGVNAPVEIITVDRFVTEAAK